MTRKYLTLQAVRFIVFPVGAHTSDPEFVQQIYFVFSISPFVGTGCTRPQRMTG